jgi:hypothetical protein
LVKRDDLDKAICSFIGEYFGFEVVELKACSQFSGNTTITGRTGRLQLACAWVAARAPQQNYRCRFKCSEFDVLALVCSDAVNA